MENVTRRAFVRASGVTVASAVVMLAAATLGRDSPADAHLLRLDIERDRRWNVVNLVPAHDDEGIDGAHDEWVEVVEEIADLEAKGLAGIQVKARTLEQYSDGSMLSTDKDSLDGRLLDQILSFVLQAGA